MKKKIVSLFVTVVIIVVSFLSYTGCAPQTASAEAVDDAGNKYSVVNLTQTARPNKDYLSTEVSWYDENYNYYVYNLGTILNVPLTSTYTVYSYNGGQASYSEEITKTTTESIEQQTARTMTASVALSLSTTVNVKTSLSAGLKKIIDVGVETGFSQSITNDITKTNAWSETVSNCVAKSEEQRNSLTLTFNEKCEYGYYLYLHLGHVRVYGAIIQSRSDHSEIYAQTYSEIYANQYSLHYNGDSPDFPIDVREKINFDLSSITELTPPTKNFIEEESYPPYTAKATFPPSGEVDANRNRHYWIDMSSYFNEYYYSKGYNKISIYFSVWVKCNGLSNKVHGDVCYSVILDDEGYLDTYDGLYYFQEQTKKEWKKVEGTVTADLRLFSYHKKAYLLFRNDNWFKSFTVKDVIIEVTLYKE